jgi:hypothetical protein
MLIAPSKTPGLTFQPWPISICQSPPSNYFCEEISSISRLISNPSQIYPLDVKVYPDKPEPQPISSTNDPASRLSN